jgi:TolB-like protein
VLLRRLVRAVLSWSDGARLRPKLLDLDFTMSPLSSLIAAVVATSSTSTLSANPVPMVKAMRVTVFTLRSQSALESLAKRTTEELLVHLGRNPGLIAIGEAEMRVLAANVKDRNDLLDCPDEEACLAKIKAIVQTDKIITGHLGPWGRGYLCTLTLSDAKNASVERSESATADNEAELSSLVARAADRLMRKESGALADRPARIAKGTKVAVLDLQSYGVPPDLAENLTQLLSLELRKAEELSVISRDEIKAMLQYEAQKQILTCRDDVACLIEIGGALGVEYLVSGGVGELDDTWVVHLKLLDTAKAEVAARVSASFRGPQTELAKTVRFAVLALLGKSAEGVGTVMVLSDVVPASLSIDGEPAQTLPIGSISRTAGKHALSLRADGYFPLRREFYVDPGLLTRVDLAPNALPRPWYREWWPWAIGGSVIVAGVASVLIVSSSHTATPPVAGSVHVGVR